MSPHSSSSPHREDAGSDRPSPQTGRIFPPETTEEAIRIDRFPFLLGRHPECDFALFSRLVSRHHCRFFVRSGTIWVEDMNSHNGTFLNDREVREAEPIFADDRLVIHPYYFQCRYETDAKGKEILRLVRIPEPDPAEDDRTLQVQK